MDFVLSKITKERISILQFEKLSNEKKEILKRNLICKQCSVQAFYRRKTRDGKQACFYARHISGCDEGMSNPSNSDDSTKEEINKINVTYNELVLSLENNFKSHEFIKTEDNDSDDYDNKGSRSYVIDPSKNRSCKTTLKKLLKYAINEHLDDIDIPIVVEGKTFRDPADLIIHFNSINYSQKDQKMIFWGKINSSSTNGQFLNSGIWDGKGYEFSVLLDESVAKSTKLSKVAWNSGINCIVLGKLSFNKNDKPYVRVNDINLIAIEK